MLCMLKSLIAIIAEQSKRIGGPTIHRFAVERGDVVLGDRAPMCVAVAPARPAFDAGEQSLDAGAVAINIVIFGPDLAGNDVAFPLLRRRKGLED